MRNELAFRNSSDALATADILLRNEYVCLLSCEENLTILNFEYIPNADRKGIAFMPQDEFEEILFSEEKDIDE